MPVWLKGANLSNCEVMPATRTWPSCSAFLGTWRRRQLSGNPTALVAGCHRPHGDIRLAGCVPRKRSIDLDCQRDCALIWSCLARTSSGQRDLIQDSTATMSSSLISPR